MKNMRSLTSERLTAIFLSSQTVLTSLLLYWMLLETESNAFLRTWLLQNFPIGLTLLNRWVVTAAVTSLSLLTGYWVFHLERETKTRTKNRPTERKQIPIYSGRRSEIFLLTQTLVITLLLLWVSLEEVSNAFLRTWLLQNYPISLN